MDGVVSLGRFELPTPGLGNLCSILLSYRDIYDALVAIIAITDNLLKCLSVNLSILFREILPNRIYIIKSAKLTFTKLILAIIKYKSSYTIY